MQREGADSEALGNAFQHQGPIFINAYCQSIITLVDQDRGEGNDLLQ